MSERESDRERERERERDRQRERETQTRRHADTQSHTRTHARAPQAVTIGGTLRAFSKEVYSTIERRAKEVLQGTARAHGCSVEFHFTSFADDCMLGNAVPPAPPSLSSRPCICACRFLLP